MIDFIVKAVAILLFILVVALFVYGMMALGEETIEIYDDLEWELKWRRKNND